jgi:hypothetical protein
MTPYLTYDHHRGNALKSFSVLRRGKTIKRQRRHSKTSFQLTCHFDWDVLYGALHRDGEFCVCALGDSNGELSRLTHGHQPEML